jgi:hypothetical protein
MDQQNSRDNRKGPVSHGIDVINNMRGNINTAVKITRVVSIFSSWWILGLILAGFFLFVFFNVLTGGGAGGGGGGGGLTAGGGGGGGGGGTTGVCNSGSTQSSITGWAKSITSCLQVGADGFFDILTAPVSNGSYTTHAPTPYECTYLVVDSYNLSGYSGLSYGSDGAVAYMISFWKSNPNYLYLDYYNLSHQTILSQVQPGYAIFFQTVPGQTTVGDDHTAIVGSLTLDSLGSGSMVTYNANSPASAGTAVRYSVYLWDIVNQGSQQAVGFGFVR